MNTQVLIFKKAQRWPMLKILDEFLKGLLSQTISAEKVASGDAKVLDKTSIGW